MSLPRTSLDLALWAVLDAAPETPAWTAYGIARNVLHELSIPEHLPPPTFTTTTPPDPITDLWTDTP